MNDRRAIASSLALSPVFILISLFLGACSQSPITVIERSGQTLALLDQHKIDRQRRFVISGLSRIALETNTYFLDEHEEYALEEVDQHLTKSAFTAFNRNFASVGAINNDTQGWNSDFIVKTSLLDARHLMIEPEPVQLTSPSHYDEHIPSGYGESQKKDLTVIRSRVKPFKALLKFELMDAKTRRLLDVALVNSRSGASGSLSFKQLLETGIEAYIHQLKGTHVAFDKKI